MRDGQFRLDGSPPARYRVTAWHEGRAATGKVKDGRPLGAPPRVLIQVVTAPAKDEVAAEFELT